MRNREQGTGKCFGFPFWATSSSVHPLLCVRSSGAPMTHVPHALAHIDTASDAREPVSAGETTTGTTARILNQQEPRSFTAPTRTDRR